MPTELLKTQLPARKRATKKDWVDAALRLLGREGLDAVTIDRLCKEIGLTTGSFYWHFKGRRDLLSATTQGYLDTGKSYMAQVQNNSELGPLQKLQELHRITAAANHGNIDRAMRVWATNSEESRIAVESSDQGFLEFVEVQLQALGLSRSDAKAASVLMLAVGVGVPAISPSVDKDALEGLTSVFEQFLLSLAKTS